MDISTDFAAASTDMKLAQVQTAASVAVMKKTMDAQTDIASQLIDMLSLSVGSQQPHMLDMEV